MAMLAEQNLPYVNTNKGYTTKKPITIQGSANLDMSGSTGVLIFPSGGTSGQVSGNINVTATGLTLTTAQSGSIITLNPSAAVTITLPTPAVGLKYTFYFATAATSSNTVKVITGTILSQFMQGYVNVPVAAGTAKYFYGDGSTMVSLNFNGTTTGGLLGGDFSIVGLSSTIWQVTGNAEGSGTVATPFGTS